MRIIPAIDLLNGQCVRLSQGQFDRVTLYNSEPLDVAKQFEDAGLTHLHLVDLDGAKAQSVTNYKILEMIATKTNLQIDFGGGIRSQEDIKIVLESGAKQVTAGSLAISGPELFLKCLDIYGSERLILGADAKHNKVAVHGWTQSSTMNVETFIGNYVNLGVEYVVCTDISKDGMLEGPAFALYDRIIKQSVKHPNNKPLRLIASGGVSELSDLKRLETIGCEAVILGKAIYENRITLKELSEYQLNRTVC